MTKRTAAIIVNWNNSSDTMECIRSLQILRNAPLIIVVDNGSKEQDLSLLRSIQGIQLITSPDNLGFGRGNNLGIQWAMIHTGCDHVLLINNDATVGATGIVELENALDADESIGITAPLIVFAHDPSLLWYGGGEISWARGSVKVPGYGQSAFSSLAMMERDVTFASGCALLIKRKVIEAIGGFDPRFFMYEEDVEYCMRVLEYGWRIRYVPRSVVYHKVQGGRTRVNNTTIDVLSPHNPALPFYVYHILRNRLLNMHLHARRGGLLIFLLVFPLYLMKKIAAYIYHRRFDGISAMTKGALSFWRDRKQEVRSEVFSGIAR